jgi:hypothetical protein
MVACYIDSSFPAMLLFAYKYAESLEGGILASANAGGEVLPSEATCCKECSGAQFVRRAACCWKI